MRTSQAAIFFIENITVEAYEEAPLNLKKATITTEGEERFWSNPDTGD